MRDQLWTRVNPDEIDIVQPHLTAFPVKVGELAKELGLEVYKSPLPPSISGMIKPSTSKADGYEIRVNKFESVERQRFTLAHEIAHFLLHKADIRAGVIDSVMYRSALTSKKEAEANRLAADIVMPKELVQKELLARGGIPSDEVAEELARVFRVSTAAMKIRIGAP